MSDVNIVASALLAYATAVLKEKETSNRVLRSAGDALAQDVLLGMVGLPELLRARSQPQVIKIVYHRLAIEHEPASHLPCPDIEALASPNPPATEFIKLYSIILVRQTVWSEDNSRYVQVIQGLSQSHQECLKGIIESALEGLPEESVEGSVPDKGADDGLREADLFYKAQKRSSDLQAKLTAALRAAEAARTGTTENEMNVGDRQDTPKRTPASRKTSVEDSNFTLGDSDSDSDDDLKHTSHPDRGGAPRTVSNPVHRGTAMERMNELEMERLQADLNDKADELRQLEVQLEESRRTVQIYSSRIAELEFAVEEVERLRDEVEVHRHSAERLRKSENVVDKLKKKLETASGMRAEITDLQKQVKALSDENSEWESKYTALIRSRKSNMSSRKTAEETVPETHMPDRSARLHQLELDAHAKEAEIVRLKTMLHEGNPEDGGHSGNSMLDRNGDVSPTKTTQGDILSPPVSGRLLSPEFGHDSDTLENSSPVSPDAYNRLQQKVFKLEALLAKASLPQGASGAQSGALHASAQGGKSNTAHLDSTPATDKEALRLKVQDALAETDMRYRTEKLLMLKAWTDLGQRAMKMGGGPDGSSSSQNAPAGPPVELSWANRVRRQMHSVEPKRQQA